jgi:putative flippase GtrA
MKKNGYLYSFFCNKFFRFLIIGGINTVFGYGLYVFIVLLGFNYKIAVLVSTIGGIIFNYFSSGTFVFKYKSIFKIRTFLLFIFSYFIIYLFNIFLIKILLDLGYNEIISGGICIIPTACFSFFLLNFLVFR